MPWSRYTICTRWMSIGLLFMQMISVARGEESSPDAKEFASLDFRKLTALAIKIRAKREADQKWTPGAEWGPIKTKLAKVPRESPKQISGTATVFKEFREASPECLEFCHTILASSSEDLIGAHSLAVETLAVVKARDDKSIELVLRAASSAEFPAPIVKILAESFGDNAYVATTLKKWAEGPKSELQRSAAQFSAALPAGSPADGIDNVVATICSTDVGRLRAVQSLVASMVENPFKYRHSLKADHLRQLLAAMRSNNSEVVSAAAYLILAGADKVPDEFVNTLIDAQCAECAPLLTAVGFLSPGPLNEKQLSTIESVIKTKVEEPCAGLVSYFWRGGGNIKFVIEQMHNMQNAKWGPNLKYWGMFTNSTADQVVEPPQWKEYWKRFPEEGPTIVRLVEAFPNAPETSWVIEKALSDRLSSEVLLATLWNIRTHGKGFSTVKGLHEYLNIESAKPDSKAIRAASLLFHCYGDRETVLAVVRRARERDPQIFRQWSDAVTAVLEADPQAPILDDCRKSFLTPINGQKQAGDDWFGWLLDIRMEKSGSKPPLESLALALRYSDGNWLEALASAGPNIYPVLDDLRDPFLYVFASTGSRNSNRVIEYLGALDRLEKAKRDFMRREQK